MAGQAVAQQVGVDDVDVVRGAAIESPGAARVDLHGGQRTTQPAEWSGQCAVAGGDLDDRVWDAGREGGDRVDHRPVDEEVLAELVRTARKGRRHGDTPVTEKWTGQRRTAAPVWPNRVRPS